MILCKLNRTLNRFWLCLLLLLRFLATGLLIDAIKYLAGTLVSRSLLYCRDHIVVIQILWTEQEDMRTTLVALAGAITTVETVAAILALGFLLLLSGNACCLLLSVMTLAVA